MKTTKYLFKEGVYFLLFALLFFTANANAQLVTNGGFEDSDVGEVSGSINGWDLSMGDGATGKFIIVDDTVQHGQRALKVDVNTLGSNAWSIQAVAVNIPIRRGDTYSYSVWARARNSGGKASFTVGDYSYSEYFSLRGMTLTTTWTRFTGSFTVGNDSTRARAPIHFSISGNAGNAIFIDSLSIVSLSDTNVWNGPPLAHKQRKFVGNIYSTGQKTNFKSYWNQVTPENAGKWGSVEGTRDVMNWAELDSAYALAKNNNYPFRYHVLIWGAQQPGWISSLQPAEQLEEIEEWFQAVADRYPNIENLEVVNEPLNQPPDGGGSPARANYINALGGTGTTGYDWILNAFRMARRIFPKTTKLVINEYSVINSLSRTSQYLQVIRLLQAENLIDVIGEQAHAFTTYGTSTALMKACLDSLGATGLSIQITELDIDSISNVPDRQLSEYQRVFPLFYQHPSVMGITLWGWRVGLWRTEAYLLRADGTERPALQWLRTYLDTVNLPTSVDEIVEGSKPQQYKLYNNYPNPFNPTTTIAYEVPKTEHISLSVYNALGQEVAKLVNERKAAGRYEVRWNAFNIPSGIYFYRMTAGNFTATKKLLLVK